MRTSGAMIAALLCATLGAALPAHAQAPGCPQATPTDVARALGASDFAGVLATMLAVETATCGGLVLQKDAIGFRLNDTTRPVYGGIRSEVAVDFPFQEADLVRYSWEMKFPSEFRGDPARNRWWLVAQWHDQPDRRVGETWDGFPPQSPPVALQIEERNGVPGLALVLNGGERRSWAAIPLDEWLRVTVTLRWRTNGDGELSVDVADHPEFATHVVGRNMHNSFQHYLKLGQYRHPKIAIDSTVFFRNLRIAKINLAPVDPAH